MKTSWVRPAAWAVPFLLISALWLQARGLFSFTAGAIYSILAAGLSFAGLNALAVEPPAAPATHWVVRTARKPGAVKTLVSFAYCMLILFGLNGWVVAPPATDLSWAAAAVVCYLFTTFLTIAARSPIVADPEAARSRSGIEYAVQVSMARFLTIGTAVPVAGALGFTIWRELSRDAAIPTSVSPPAVALLYVSMCSLAFARVLFHPVSFTRIPAGYRRAGVLLAFGVLLVEALLESALRRNWYLYGLSSVTFAATLLVFSRSWAELFSDRSVPDPMKPELSTKTAASP